MTSSLKVKSNFARDCIVMLDDRHPLKFNDKGEASCPSHMRAAVERLMHNRPNRFWIVEAEKPVVVVDEPLKESVVESEEVVELELDETPKQLDLNYLTDDVEDVKEPQKKRGPKKKKQSKD